MSDSDSVPATGEPGEAAIRWLRGGVLLLLVLLTAYVWWFDYAAVSALFHPGTDAVGNLLFRVPGYSNTVYPFTYAAVAASFVGVALFVYRQERPLGSRLYAMVLAGLVANLASVGMIDAYEQVFVTLMLYSARLHPYGVAGFQLYWGSVGAAAGTAAGLLLVLVVVPWSRRENAPGVILCLVVAGAAFAAWFFAGFAEPMNGGDLSYAMNATSRIASQLALVAAVSRRDWWTGLVASLRSIRRPRSSLVPSVPVDPGPGVPPSA
jgi:hypothetical protein